MALVNDCRFIHVYSVFLFLRGIRDHYSHQYLYKRVILIIVLNSDRNCIINNIMGLNSGTKQKIALVLDVTKVVFHWGFIPTVLYLGFAKGADVGMPPLSLMQLLWH